VAQSRDDPKEFVFLTDHPDYPIAVIHLTWQAEKSGDFPWSGGIARWKISRANQGECIRCIIAKIKLAH
jgi:hypothetical protein